MNWDLETKIEKSGAKLRFTLLPWREHEDAVSLEAQTFDAAREECKLLTDTHSMGAIRVDADGTEIGRIPWLNWCVDEDHHTDFDPLTSEIHAKYAA